MLPDPLTPALAAYEASLEAMSDDEVLAEYDRAEVESPEADLIAGLMEKRGLDW